ncbi:hypothetical protein A3194_20090 [Candidatus Thiodiazotropha endoloripes]|uniref:hypothetical protein n=1 Tax=Candidatus Thiodiazotropha endoloripes TaxID=1818881 RepID=UPI00083E479B|nr:hypothetical protein [Candidatus Thiodiazotropha endoloripes]ODB94966.1 hypothetical protein A3194_20090 [Candidatus Thiodiazotropha endoloripes]
MKPQITILGLPRIPNTTISITLYKYEKDNSKGILVCNLLYTTRGRAVGTANDPVEIGTTLKISIISSGTKEYEHYIIYNGAPDICHVPYLEKETDTDITQISIDWNIDSWNKWIPSEDYELGKKLEAKYVIERSISITPLWHSYYIESDINYFEHFHKLWIGLNSFATHNTNATYDREKFMALTKSEPVKMLFYSSLYKTSYEHLKTRWECIQSITGHDMSMEICRDELSANCSIIDFFENAKKCANIYFQKHNQKLDGLAIIDSLTSDKDNQTITIGSQLDQYINPTDTKTVSLPSIALNNSLKPDSVERHGRLLFHNPYISSETFNLFGFRFNLGDYFGAEYSQSPYNGEQKEKYRSLESSDPLLYRYLDLLYTFRSSYFHGDLASTTNNNKLARSAYESLREIYLFLLPK